MVLADEPPPPPDKLRLLVPTNFSVKSEMALQYALVYSQKESAEVYLFHCYDGKDADFRRVDQLNVELVERMKDSVMRCIETLETMGIKHAVQNVHRRLSSGKPGQEILKIAAGIGADMVIVGYPTTSGMKRMIDKAPCTVVLVKAKDPTFVVT